MIIAERLSMRHLIYNSIALSGRIHIVCMYEVYIIRRREIILLVYSRIVHSYDLYKHIRVLVLCFHRYEYYYDYEA